MSSYDYEYQCCGKPCTLLDDMYHLIVPYHNPRHSMDYKICSLACLTEFVQRLRDNAAKPEPHE